MGGEGIELRKKQKREERNKTGEKGGGGERY